MSLAETASTILDETRLAARRLRRRPGRSLATLLVHPPRIGAAGALVCLSGALYLRPLPYPQPDRLLTLLTTHGSSPGAPTEYASSPIDFVAWRERARSFDEGGRTNGREGGLRR